MKKVNIKDESYSEKKGCGYYEVTNTAHGSYKRGHFVASNGVVSVYAEDNVKGNIIILTASKNDRVHYRTIRNTKTISDRTLSRRSKQFIKLIK